MPFYLRILVRFLLTLALIWAMTVYLDQYLLVTGGWTGLVIIAALITLMNLIVRPVLEMIVLPLRLIANLLAMIAVNGAFLWLTLRIVERMSPTLVTMHIQGGLLGWIVMIIAVGLGTWLISKMA